MNSLPAALARAGTVLAGAMLAASVATADAPDPITIAAIKGNYRVVVENDSVRVLEHFLASGASEARHHHPCRVTYALFGYRLLTEDGDGVRHEADRIPRSSWWSPAEDLSIKNTGSTPAKELIVEFKQPPAGGKGCAATP